MIGFDDNSLHDKWVSLAYLTNFIVRTQPKGAPQNLSHIYSSHLAMQTLVDVLVNVQKGALEPLTPEVKSRVGITLFQIGLRALLRTPKPESIEKLAYQLLILCEARRLPLFDFLECQLNDKIAQQIHTLSNAQASDLVASSNHV